MIVTTTTGGEIMASHQRQSIEATEAAIDKLLSPGQSWPTVIVMLRFATDYLTLSLYCRAAEWTTRGPS